jgi:hypothetical protein
MLFGQLETQQVTSIMFLPKIKNEDLPEELREILGDADAEFDSIVDAEDVMDIQFDPDAYYEAKHKTAMRLVESRKELERLRTEQRLNKSKDSEQYK